MTGKILITGSNGLLGQKLVFLCKQRGIDFLATSKGENRNENLSEIYFEELDICSKKQIDRVLDAYKPNYLIHCAGAYNKASADECDLEVWDDILNANFRSTYHFARHLLPQINKISGGAVIRINSRDAPHTGIGIQTAQKRAIDGYMEVLFEYVREYGTKVCTINPGFVNTLMVNPERLNPELMMQPEDISQVVQFVLSTSATACPTEIIIQPQRSPWKSTGMHL